MYERGLLGFVFALEKIINECKGDKNRKRNAEAKA